MNAESTLNNQYIKLTQLVANYLFKEAIARKCIQIYFVPLDFPWKDHVCKGKMICGRCKLVVSVLPDLGIKIAWDSTTSFVKD